MLERMPIVNWGASSRNRMERKYLKSKISFKIPKISKMDPRQKNHPPQSRNESTSPMDQYYCTAKNQNNGIGPGFTPPWAHLPNLIPIPGQHNHGGPAPRKRKMIEELGTSVAEPRKYYDNSPINFQNHLEKCCEKYKSRITDLVLISSKEKSGFQLQISKLEKEISDLKKSEIQISDLKNESEIEIKDENESKSSLTESMNEKPPIQVNHHHQGEFKKISDCQEQFKNISYQKIILESKISELESKFANLQQTLHVTDLQRYQLKKTNSELTSKIISLEKELSEIKNKSDLKVVEMNVVDEGIPKCPECILHKSQISNLESKSTKLQKNLDETVKEKDELIQTNIEVIKKNVENEKDLQFIQNQIKQVMENGTDLQNKNHNLEKCNIDLEKRNTNLIQDCASYKSQIFHLENHSKKIKELLEKAKAETKMVKTKNEKLENKFGNLENRVSELKISLDTMKKNCDFLQEQVNNLTFKNHNQTTDLEKQAEIFFDDCINNQIKISFLETQNLNFQQLLQASTQEKDHLNKTIDLIDDLKSKIESHIQNNENQTKLELSSTPKTPKTEVYNFDFELEVKEGMPSPSSKIKIEHVESLNNISSTTEAAEENNSISILRDEITLRMNENISMTTENTSLKHEIDQLTQEKKTLKSEVEKLHKLLNLRDAEIAILHT